jgi:ketosteroid isomerase-like protein
MAGNEKTNAKLAREIYQWTARGDLNRIADYVTDNIQLTNFVMPGVRRGRQELLNTLQTLKREYSDFQVEITNQTAVGDTVVNEFTFRGTNDGPLTLPTGQEIPATHRRVDTPMCEVWDFKGGKVDSIRCYADSGAFMEQLGLIPQMATSMH